MTPLREAHAHIAQHGRAMTMERFESCASLDACLDQLARVRGDGWLLGQGLRIESWPDPTWPTAAQLDPVTANRPTCVWSFDYHALIVNTAAMNAVGITPNSPDPANGRIVRDKSGQPTGLMLEAAAKAVWSAIPEPTPTERREHVRAALKDLASHGFTEIHDLLSQPWLGPLLAELHDAGELPCRILLYPRVEEVAQVHSTAAAWQRDTLRLAGAKLFADGTLNSRTAFMLHPYADPLPGLPRGQEMATPGQIHDAIALTRQLGIGLAIHAIGDAAVRSVLDAYQRRDRKGASDNPTLPHGRVSDAPPLRIEHAEIIDDADIPRFAQLGVVCSVQPCHLLADIEALTRGLPHRLNRVLPLKDLIQSGCRPGELLWFGSDTPIVRPHPQDSIQAAVHRRRPDGGPTIAADQALTESDAWAAFR